MTNGAQPATAGAKQRFNKRHLDPHELLDKLRRQGMTIDADTALPYLAQVGGYRMKGYWYHWQDRETKRFQPGTDFRHVIERYEFDRELRRITSDALERIELMVRSTISNVMSKHEGPHWFMNDALFAPKPPDRQGDKESLSVRIEREVLRMNRKPFVWHYLDKYSHPSLPPSWAISECLSFGVWSATYPTLASLAYRKEIGRRFKVEEPDVLQSWLHAFSVMRNTVAHHGRLIGAQTGVTPREYKKRRLTFTRDQTRTFFVVASVINYVCQSIHRGPRWKADLLALFAKYPGIPITGGLGFPSDWHDLPAWR